MCRNIRRLHNLAPAVSADEIRDAALQFVRKVSGTRTPSRVNQEPFERAVDDVTAVVTRLLEELQPGAPPADREVLAARARARYARRAAG